MALNLNPKRVKKNKQFKKDSRPKIVQNHLHRSQRRLNQPHIIQEILSDEEVLEEFQEELTRREITTYLDDLSEE